MRPIDADALIHHFYETEYASMYYIEVVKRIIDEQPTLSPDDVRGVGEWKAWEDYYGSIVYKCSVCGEDWDMIDGTPEDNDMNYCPNCGSAMKGE